MMMKMRLLVRAVVVVAAAGGAVRAQLCPADHTFGDYDALKTGLEECGALGE